MPNGDEKNGELRWADITEPFTEMLQAENTETGETLELGRKEDNTLWLEGFHIADYNPDTGEIAPSEDVIRWRTFQEAKPTDIVGAVREKAMPEMAPALGRLVRYKETDEEKLGKLIAYGGIDEAEAQKIIETSKLDLSSDEWLEKVREINPSFRKGFFDSLFMRSVAAGYGDLITGAAGVADWASMEGIHKNLTEVARSFQFAAPPQENWDVSLKTVLDPRFWSTVVARALPFSVSMIPISLLTFGAGTVAFGAIGFGTWSTHLLASIFGGVSGAVLESAFEAGHVWNEAKAMGFSDDEAGEAAQSTLLKGIGALTGTNAIELFAMFLPDPTRILSRLVGRGLVTVTRVAGKVTFVGLTEAGEEAVQDVISRQALGQEVKLDDDMKMQMLVGFLMGAGIGGGADVLTTISNRTVNRLGDEHFLQWQEEFNRLKAEGATEEQAAIAALDKIADEEVNKITDEISKATIKEEAIKSLKPKSRAEELSATHDLDKARKEASVTPEEVPTVPEVGIIHKTSPIEDVAAIRSGERLFAEQGEGVFLLAIGEETVPKNLVVERIGDGSEVLYLKSKVREVAPIIRRLKEMVGTPATIEKIIERGRLFGYSEADINAFLAEQGLRPPAVEVATDIKTKAALTKRIQQLIDTKGFLTKKDIPNAEARKIFKEFQPKGNLKGMSKAQLRGVLQRINESRPKNIEGRTVITEETERHIVALRSSLMRANLMSDVGYERIGNILGFTTDRYVDKGQFLTESEGKALIREVNRQAELGLTEWDARVAEGVKTRPDIGKKLEDVNRRIEKPLKAIQWIKLPGLPSLGDFWDMTRYYQELQRATERAGGKFFDVFRMMVKQANINDFLILALDKSLKEACPEVNGLVRDKEASARVASFLRGEDPADITEIELKAAKHIRAEYDTVKNMIRYHRVRWGIDLHEGDAELIAKDILGKHPEKTMSPDEIKAIRAEVAEAVRQWETGGETAMARYLADKAWGVLESGYDPRIIHDPKLALAEIKHVRISKTELYGRTQEEIPVMEENPFLRRRAYFKRLFALELEPYFKEMDRMYDGVKPFLKNPQHVSKVVTTSIREFRGYFPEHLFTRWAMKTGGYAFSIFAMSPHMSIRNLHQNIVLHPDVVEAFHPGNQRPSAAQQQFTDVHVQQDIAIRREWLMQEALGTFPMSRLIRWVTYYHKSDKMNRAVSMWLSTNKARRALEASQRSGNLDDYLKGSGFYDLQPLEQRYILELKALPEVDFGADIPIVSGDEAAIWEQGRLRTEKSHFRYKRRERAAVEQGEVGRVFGSLLTFPRGYVQNLYDYFQKLDPRADVPLAERGRVAKNLIMVVAGSIAANALYGLITGKGREPYDPVEVLSWTFGGLAVGSVQQITEIAADTARALMGDEDALNRVITGMPRVAEMFLPFYKQVIDITEAIIGKRYIDRYAGRKIKEVFDETYKVQESYYEAPRTWIQMAQHMFFGTTYLEQTEEEEEKKKEKKEIPIFPSPPGGGFKMKDVK